MYAVPASTQASGNDLREMQERNRRFQLARVLKATEEMLEVAQTGDWGRVEELESLRRHELEECFHQQEEQPSALVAEALATLLYLNEQLVQIVRFARRKMADERQHQQRKVSAARAYSEDLQ